MCGVDSSGEAKEASLFVADKSSSCFLLLVVDSDMNHHQPLIIEKVNSFLVTIFSDFYLYYINILL